MGHLPSCKGRLLGGQGEALLAYAMEGLGEQEYLGGTWERRNGGGSYNLCKCPPH